jgi:ribulose-phosphate 3-epimerase
MKIVPSILTDRLGQLRGLLKKAEAFTDYVQIDFMDGLFVPSKSVSPKDMEGVKTSVACEAHLMVQEPELYFRDLEIFGFRRIIFHGEADGDTRTLTQRIREHGIEAGIAANPETDISSLDGLISELDCILFLSVKPGFYGSPFIPSVLDKIRKCRERYPSIVIGIDGGVAPDNISQIKSVGVDYACVGSRIFLSADPAGSYREFQERAEG